MNILIPIDASPEAAEAANFAGLLHARMPGAATLLSVLSSPDQQPQGQNWLESVRARNPTLADADLQVHAGNTADEIVAIAASGAYDIVVMGQRGQSRFAQMLIGNTAIEVMRHSPIPLIIVHESRTQIERILVCTSGSEYARSNVEMASRIAAAAGAMLTIMHVMSQVDITPSTPSPSLGQQVAWHMEQETSEGVHLEKMMAIAREHGLAPELLIRYGLVVDEILAETRSGDYDLVVVGMHHRRGFRGFLLDDITRAVISHLRRPVLIVR